MIIKMQCYWGSRSAVKNLPAVQETQEVRVLSLLWEDPLEEEVATCASIFLPGESRGQRNLGHYSLSVHRVEKSQTGPSEHTHKQGSHKLIYMR